MQETLVRWSDKVGVNVILTTGGTGFSSRDVTPEATKKVIDKEAPGITYALFSESFKITPLAILSRYSPKKFFNLLDLFSLIFY